MKFIIASERARLLREKSQYLANYDKNKATYDEQKTKFEEAVTNYSSNMETFIKSFLSAELDKLPNTTVSVKKANINSTSAMYYIVLEHKSSREAEYQSRDYEYHISGGSKRGISWKFSIYLKDNKSYDDQGQWVTHRVLNKVPEIVADIMDSNDYAELQATYNLFTKIDTIDWEAVINQINNSVPKKENYVTVENPGYKDTSKWDDAISAYNLNRIVGKDAWIKVNIIREDSYDRWNSTNAGVDGTGWIRIKSATDKFYVFNWLEDRYSNRSNKSNGFLKSYVEGALTRTYKLKKIYIHPLEPIEYSSTEDLIAPIAPHIDFGEDE